MNISNMLIGFKIKRLYTGNIVSAVYHQTVFDLVEQLANEFKLELQDKTRKEVVIVYDFESFGSANLKVKLYGYEGQDLDG